MSRFSNRSILADIIENKDSIERLVGHLILFLKEKKFSVDDALDICTQLCGFFPGRLAFSAIALAVPYVIDNLSHDGSLVQDITFLGIADCIKRLIALHPVDAIIESALLIYIECQDEYYILKEILEESATYYKLYKETYKYDRYINVNYSLSHMWGCSIEEFI